MSFVTFPFGNSQLLHGFGDDASAAALAGQPLYRKPSVFPRGIRFANAPGGKANDPYSFSNVLMHFNSMVPAIQFPSDNVEKLSGVFLNRRRAHFTRIPRSVRG